MKQTEKTDPQSPANFLPPPKNNHTYSDEKKPFTHWLHKNWYYHQLVTQFYLHTVPAGSRVLHVNCKNGYLLNALQPCVGVGIDTNTQHIADAQKIFPTYSFY